MVPEEYTETFLYFKELSTFFLPTVSVSIRYTISYNDLSSEVLYLSSQQTYF